MVFSKAGLANLIEAGVNYLNVAVAESVVDDPLILFY